MPRLEFVDPDHPRPGHALRLRLDRESIAQVVDQGRRVALDQSAEGIDVDAGDAQEMEEPLPLIELPGDPEGDRDPDDRGQPRADRGEQREEALDLALQQVAARRKAPLKIRAPAASKARKRPMPMPPAPARAARPSGVQAGTSRTTTSRSAPLEALPRRAHAGVGLERDPAEQAEHRVPPSPTDLEPQQVGRERRERRRRQDDDAESSPLAIRLPASSSVGIEGMGMPS